MPWPSTTEYNDAIQNLRTSVSDEELQAGELARTPQGLPLLWSGRFAAVYQVHCPGTGNTWAVKCFTCESPGLRDRYRQISDHLERARLRFMVDFELVEPGILVGGQWHPFLKMRWVEGLALNEFVERNLDRPATLRQLLGLWVKLAARLRKAQIAHADLQHGNVILVPLPQGQLALRLIDYDGMYVPALAGTRSREVGHPAYQHPQRLREGIYSLEVDRFSHLAIYSAVSCLTAGKRQLWAQFNNDDNLLFREADFTSPRESGLFHQLWALRDEDARALVGHLILATQMPLDRVPLLSEVASNGTVRRLSRDQQQRVEQLLGRGASGVRIVRPFAPWASTMEYYDALRNLRTSVSDEELRAGEVARTPLGLPMVWSGNFADVYRVHCARTGSTWAVKCFTRTSPKLKERYREISAHLNQARLPFMVDCQFVEPGIRAGGGWHPFLKMRWVEGLALNAFVEQYLERPATLRQLLGLWEKLAARLRHARIAHADLQHGNVLLVPLPQGRLALRLIDYDPMYVPSLAGTPSGELGHPAYQHPQRLREGTYNPEVDRFSQLAIYTAVRCLTVGKRQLWTRFDNGDNLLFREIDFTSPGESEVFHQLWALRDEDARALVGQLILATQMPMDRVPPLTEVVSNGTVRRLSRDQQQRVEQLLGRGAPGARNVRPSVPSEPPPPRGGGPFPLQGGSPPARSPAPAAPKGPWWVSGQPAAGKAQPSPIPSRPFGVKATPSTSPQPIPVGRKEIAIDLGGGVRIELVRIPAGEFLMGSPDSDRHAGSDEKPQHRVRITKPFYLGKYEVTQREWQSVMGGNPSLFQRRLFQRPKNPVENVSWDDCQAFLGKLNQQQGGRGMTFRLPTEAEWEYACRAGRSTRWCFGDEEGRLGNYAWCHANCGRSTHPVGQKRPNAWGLYDMHGNVWEWCSDWYGRGYYGESPGNDPTGPFSGSCRVHRGGSWHNDAWSCRSANRDDSRPGRQFYDLGLRVSLEVVE